MPEHDLNDLNQLIDQAPSCGTVNLTDRAKLAYWLGTLKVTEERLREVIAEVGPDVNSFRLYLGRW